MISDDVTGFRHDNIYDSLGLVDIDQMENLQTVVSLILITAPPIQENDSMDTAMREKIKHYNNAFKNGNVLKCSSMVNSVSGMSEFSLKEEKYIENSIKEQLMIPLQASTGAKDITLKFNEDRYSTAFNTFNTIYEYMKKVIRGNIRPSENALKFNELDYFFSVYVINLEPNGIAVQSTIKFANCFLKSVNHDPIQPSKQVTEHKQTDIAFRCQTTRVNDFENTFYELYELGILKRGLHNFTIENRQIHGTQTISNGVISIIGDISSGDFGNIETSIRGTISTTVDSFLSGFIDDAETYVSGFITNTFGNNPISNIGANFAKQATGSILSKAFKSFF